VVLRRPTMLGSISARRTLFLAAFGLHLGLVYVASRLAGIRSSFAVATMIAVGGLAAGVAILVRGGERETARQRGRERRGRRIGRTLP
jgi:hypothetical protein